MFVGDEISRREFLRAAGAAGAGLALGATGVLAGAATTMPASGLAALTVPIRPFGKTGVKLPCLGFGAAFDVLAKQDLLAAALKYGLTYWDTAESYARGKSEKGIGQYLRKHPADRKRIFLVSKAFTREPERIGALLDQSLERLGTDHIDLYHIHAIRGPEELSRWGKQWKAWAEGAKKSGKIKLLGISTHQNMAAVLAAVAKLGWIDGVLVAYNYRFLKDDKMQAALEACHKAGKGLIAMKMMAVGPFEHLSARPGEPHIRLLEPLRRKGWSEPQAKLKAVWSDKRIASISTRMNKPEYLRENVAAAMDRKALSPSDLERLGEHARRTRGGYCAGCAERCESAVAGAVPICDVMRYLMYYRAYGDRSRARELFAALPEVQRRRLGRMDYSAAERSCPQHLPIADLMRQAARVLA